MWAVRSMIFLLLALLAGAASPAGELPPVLVFDAPPAYRSLVARLQALDPRRLEAVMRLVGLDRPGPPIRVLLAPEGSDLARSVPPWVSGYAFGAEGFIVLLPGRTPPYPDASLVDLLGHEVAHVLAARAAAGRPLPRWFQEGVAMVAGSSWGLEDRSRLTYTLIAGGAVPLAVLDERFREGEGAAGRAYAIAGSFVRDLLEQNGPRAVAGILAGVAAGEPFERAFRQATGAPLADAEAAFWRRQTFWYRWVPALTSTFALWLAITLLALYARHRRRARDAALRRLWDEEDHRLAERTAGDEWVN
jgi:hypothetical protein